jgi:ribonuclease HII
MKKLTREPGKPKRAARWIIGVDESGTGAFAGPFTVCAFLCRSVDSPYLYEVGARDSKQLTHARRVKLCTELAAACAHGEIIEVAHDYTDQRKAWREGIAQAVKSCFAYLDWDTSSVEVIIDGSSDATLAGYFARIWGVEAKFLPSADKLIPAVSAASIFAKTRRTEIMEELHAQYPVYGWSRGNGAGNAGYGTDDHLEAIAVHGVCALHRRVRPLIPYFGGEALAAGSEEPLVQDGGGAL